MWVVKSIGHADYFSLEPIVLPSWVQGWAHQGSKNRDLPMPKIGLPLRVALLGKAKSPPLNSTLYLLTKEKAIERLNSAINTIS